MFISTLDESAAQAYDLSSGQRVFNEAELFADEAAAEPEFVEVEKHYRKRTRLTTDKLPENLPIEVVKYELSESKQICSECGSDLHVMGCDTRRELVIIVTF